MKKQEKNGAVIDAEAFVRAWQEAASFKDVMAAFPKASASQLSQRAVGFRKNKVPLQKFPQGASGIRHDYKKLAALAKSLRPK